MTYLKELLKFLKKKPNKLVAYVSFLSFLIIFYWLSRADVLLYAGLGAAIGLFPSFND